MSVFYGRTAKDYKGEYRMQIQQQNFNSPAFQAIKLNTITKGARRIDIYSLGEQDRFFAEKMLNAAKGQVFPADSKILGGETVREVFDSAFKTAGRLGKYAHDRVFLAVENGKKITGVIEVKNGGDMYVKGLAVWNNDALTRDSLVVSALKDTHDRWSNFCAFIIPTAEQPSSVKTYFRRLGFRTPREFGNKNLMVDADRLDDTIPAAEKALQADIKENTVHRFVNLSKKFDVEV